MWLGMLLATQRLADERTIAEWVTNEATIAAHAGIGTFVAPHHANAQPYRMLDPWCTLASLRATALSDAATVGTVFGAHEHWERLSKTMKTVGSVGTGPVGIAVAAGYSPQDFAGRLGGEATYDDRFRARWDLIAMIASAVDDDGSRWVTPDLVWCCCSTPLTVERAAARGAVPYFGPDAMAAGNVKPGCERNGAVMRFDVFLTATKGGPDEAPDYVRAKYSRYREWGLAIPDDAALVGDPAQVVRGIEKIRSTIEPEGLVLRIVWPDMNGDDADLSVRTFTEEVLPALRGAEGAAPVPAGAPAPEVPDG